jgi:hypothetical protein
LHWTNIFFYSLYGSLKSLTSGSAAGENMALKNVEIPKAMEASKIIANELRKSKRTQSITQKQSKGLENG